MPNSAKLFRKFIALSSGLLFGTGLVISQMVNPDKIINFLDITGNWDPSLIFVMGGALAIYGTGYWLFVHKRTKAILGETIAPTNPNPIDKNLLAGAALFGIGWGVSGLCPGPAATAAARVNR